MATTPGQRRERPLGEQHSAKSSKQAVAVSPEEPAEVEPARDGTTYVVAGTAGTPRYAWTGAHETDRNFAAGKGSGAVVPADAARQVGPYVNEPDFSERPGGVLPHRGRGPALTTAV
jgi:hypothetical protein